MTLFEVNQAAAIIKETAHPDVNLIFGAVIDPSLADEIRITVIATGFERTSTSPKRPVESQPVRRPEIGRPLVAADDGEKRPVHAYAPVTVAPSSAPVVRQTERPFEPRTINTEDLDIPTFLRNRKFS